MKELIINLFIILGSLLSSKKLLSFHAIEVLSLFHKIHKFQKMDWAYLVSVSYAFSGLSQLCKILGVFFFWFALTSYSFKVSVYCSCKCKFSYKMLHSLKVYAQSVHFKGYLIIYRVLSYEELFWSIKTLVAFKVKFKSYMVQVFQNNSTSY